MHHLTEALSVDLVRPPLATQRPSDSSSNHQTLVIMAHSYNQSNSNLGPSRRARWTTPDDRGPDVATPRHSPAAAVQQQGTSSYVRGAARSSVSPLSISTSPATSLLSSPSSDDESDSDYSPDETISPPSYHSLYSPSSSIGTSPADSFHFPTTPAKGAVAAPLLSPTYIASSDPLLDAVEQSNTLLATLFPSPSAPVRALPTTSVNVDDLVGVEWQACVVNDAQNGLRTLYIGNGKLEDLELREAVMDVIDRAEEQWQCNGVVMALPKDAEDLGATVHALLYAGFTVVKNADASADHILVGLDI
ncbi:hypothetical protein JCM8547_001167 [Rhodosporidiobolus lusitaniae]